jgi:hypothetical protein
MSQPQILDSHTPPNPGTATSTTDVELLLNRDFAWQPVQPVGEGTECRAESASGDHASALILDDAIVHGSIIAAQ